MAFSNTGTVSVKTGLIRFAGTMSQMNAGLLTGGAWVVDSTAADGGVATLQFDRDQITGIGTGARVELIGAGSDFEAITGLAGNQGTFRFSSGRTFSTVAGYNNSGTTIVGTGGSALEVNGDLQNTGTIDVNGGMIVRYTSTSPLPMIRAQIVAARNGGNWDMPGITSSAARAAANHNTTLGVMEGTDFQSIYGAAAPFFGFASSDTSVLVKYTYYGDADFNGRVNFDDYVRTDNGFNNHLSGWINGDFDLNNQVNFDDYVLIDLAFNTQSGTLGRAVSLLEGSNVGNVIDPALSEVRQHLLEFGDAYRDAFLAAVPEPAEPIVAAMIGASLFRRRRRLNRPCGAAR
jgi:hypothetical protein